MCTKVGVAVVIDVSDVELTEFIPNPIEPGQRPTSFSYAFDFQMSTFGQVFVGYSYSFFLSGNDAFGDLDDIALGAFNSGSTPVFGPGGRTSGTTSSPNGFAGVQVPFETPPGQYHAFVQIAPRSPHIDPDVADAIGLLPVPVTVAVENGLPGDYNANGVVDAADYTIWRDRLGESFVLKNESPTATTPGLVDQEDYDFWKAGFEAAVNSAGTSNMAFISVPESSATAYALVVIVSPSICRRWRSLRRKIAIV